MEDAATAEISRTQVWQWIHHRAVMENGTTVSLNLCKRLIQEELLKIKAYVGEEAYINGRFVEATAIFMELIESPVFQDFLTLSAYDRIN
jgi:malate synthase